VLTQHGVKIASNSYYAHKKRPRSARSTRDEAGLDEVVRIHSDPRIGTWLYGICKVHAALVRAASTGVRCRGGRWNG
jgi:putative transposase